MMIKKVQSHREIPRSATLVYVGMTPEMATKEYYQVFGHLPDEVYHLLYKNGKSVVYVRPDGDINRITGGASCCA